jgi:hypothetical protein
MGHTCGTLTSPDREQISFLEELGQRRFLSKRSLALGIDHPSIPLFQRRDIALLGPGGVMVSCGCMVL